MRSLATGVTAVLLLFPAANAQGQNPPPCPPPSQVFITWASPQGCEPTDGIPCNVGDEIRFRPVLIPADAFCRNFVWDFGDGAVSTELEPRHAFTTPGHHRVTLRVSDDRRVSVVSTVLYLEDPWCGCNTGKGVVLSFQATPPVVSRGQAVVLTWTVGGASRLRIDPLNVEFPATPPYFLSSGSYTFIPTATATYTVTAYSFAANGLSAPVTVTVNEPTPRRRRVRK